MSSCERLVVIGASAGGVAALRQRSSALPPAFPAAVLIVLHVGAHESLLPELIGYDCALPVAHARDGEALVPGAIRIAPPDRHLMVHDGTLMLTRSPKENFARPAIDPLFRSAALAWNGRVIGVILTGMQVARTGAQPGLGRLPRTPAGHRRAVALHLPGMPRRPVAHPRFVAAPLPLPHRPRVHHAHAGPRRRGGDGRRAPQRAARTARARLGAGPARRPELRRQARRRGGAARGGRAARRVARQSRVLRSLLERWPESPE